MTFDPFLTSTSLVALAEMGDKTQLLSLVLAARYRQPLVIILGIFVATLLNHGLAAYAGHALAGLFDPRLFQWGVNLAFIAIGLWTLVPDTLGETCPKTQRGVFLTVVACFFLAEMGDKTQVATVVLGAQYKALVQVVAGTTLGMMLANIPAVLLGEGLLKRIPMAKLRIAAALLFIALGISGVGDLLHA